MLNAVILARRRTLQFKSREFSYRGKSRGVAGWAAAPILTREAEAWAAARAARPSHAGHHGRVSVRNSATVTGLHGFRPFSPQTLIFRQLPFASFASADGHVEPDRLTRPERFTFCCSDKSCNNPALGAAFMCRGSGHVACER